MLPIVLNKIAPVLGTLVVFACPVVIIWLVKHHQYRMKELELEAARLAAASPQQVAAIEARLAAIEAALALPGRSALQERAARLEGPPAEEAQAARVRQR